MIVRGDRVIVKGESGVVLAGGGWSVPVRFDGDGPPELRVRFVDTRDILREEPQPDATPDRTKPAQDLQGEIERLKGRLAKAQDDGIEQAKKLDDANAIAAEFVDEIQRLTSALSEAEAKAILAAVELSEAKSKLAETTLKAHRLTMELREARRTTQRQASVLDAIESLVSC